MKIILGKDLIPPYNGIYLFKTPKGPPIYRKFDDDWFSGEFRLDNALRVTEKTDHWVEKSVREGLDEIFFYCDLNGYPPPKVEVVQQQLGLFDVD